MAFTPSSPSSPSSPSGPPSGPPFRPRFPRGPIPNQNKDEHRINERIRVPQVRLIDEVGTQVGVVDTREALQMARDRGLDLMEVSPNSQPPVCKICDYGKFKYEKKKKDHEAKKKQTVIKVKEVQLRPQTEEHDLEYKFKNCRQFLIDGDKVKITIMFRGREITYADNGFKMMRQLADQVKDIASVESHPKLEGKKLIMILSPGASKRTTITVNPTGLGPRVMPNGSVVQPNSPTVTPVSTGPAVTPLVKPLGTPSDSNSGSST
jgi:translation initiation factor IF-3